MKLIIITCCLIGAAFANPILHNILVSTESESNSTESLSVLESSENNTSELQSSEENTSNQSSESESVESTSEDKTSEESDSQSDESDGMDSMAETKDNSMGSEENVRKSWVRVFPSIIEGASGEDNTSTEVTGHPGLLDNELSGKRPTHTKKVQIRTKQPLLGQSTDGSDTTSDSADASDSSDVSAAASDSTDSSSSSESQESQETSDSNDSSTASKSTEDSNASDSAELEQVRAKNCVNSTQSCESEEYFLQSIGDDAHSPGEHLLVPDEDERELRLRR
ncbi:PREDICTED: dentin sialophosphoprotein-like isoform X2 [Poecilia mexicana]|uniref:dentin sialophosphoprotein-like isoform X2 n=1 Tax=Poecilia formosa TaxID=48698 RepID=UPI00044390A0|nr:PREDICTED: dentin sialophosphoprotein-like isoform X2 [Poecilia formosa]XP_014845004.1 PREDICTED: dentin sialophosphoprotein-like isoform X2 [Poecilia mexicana]